jgi:hypothetical protein
MALTKPTKSVASAPVAKKGIGKPASIGKKAPAEVDEDEEEAEEEEEEAPAPKKGIGKKTAAEVQALALDEATIDGQSLSTVLTSFALRLAVTEKNLYVIDSHLVSVDDNLNMQLDLAGAKLSSLRAWAWQFLGWEADAIKAAKQADLLKAFNERLKSKDFEGWELEGRIASVVKMVPGMDATTWGDVAEASGKKGAVKEETPMPKAGPTKPPKKGAKAEEDEVDVSALIASGDVEPAQIEKMNWTQLCELAEAIDFDVDAATKGKEAPKVLRAALIATIAASQEEGDEEEEEEEEEEETEEESDEEEGDEEEESPYTKGQKVYTTHEGKKVFGTLTGAADDDGDPEVKWADGNKSFISADELEEVKEKGKKG